MKFWNKIKEQYAVLIISLLLGIIGYFLTFGISSIFKDSESNSIAHAEIYDRMKSVEINSENYIQNFIDFKKDFSQNFTEFKNELKEQNKEFIKRLDRIEGRIK